MSYATGCVNYFKSLHVIHENANEGNLRFARTLVFGFWSLYYVFNPVQNAADFPFASTDYVAIIASLPPPVLDWLWDKDSLFLLRLFAAVSAALCINRRLLFIFGLPLCLDLTLLQGVVRCFNTSHGEVVPLLAAWTLTGFCMLEPRASSQTRTWNDAFYPLFVICAILTSTYFFAGLHRVLSDPTIIFSNAMKHWAIAGTMKDNFLPPGLGHYTAKYLTLDWALRGAFLFTTVMELLSPLVLLQRKFRIFWLMAMVGFHVGTLVFMRILFWENCLLYPLFFENIRLGGRSPSTHEGKTG